MSDEAAASGIRIDIPALCKLLGIPVVATIATQRSGIDELKRAIEKAAVPKLSIRFPAEIEGLIENLSRSLASANSNTRGLLLSFLSGDNGLPGMVKSVCSDDTIRLMENSKKAMQDAVAEPISFIVAKARNEEAQRLCDAVTTFKTSSAGKLFNTIGTISHHPVWGIPVLLLVITGLYYFVGVFGAQTLVGLVEERLFGSIINPAFIKLFSYVPWAFLRDLFVGEYGVITMALTYALALILPIVTTFFLAFGVLEDSGYLPRLAFMVDRIFKKIGLNGRAVLPMVLGLGCDTMAVLTTRILTTRKEKILVTLLLALAIPCSAQLGVTLGLLGAVSGLAVAIWLGIILAVLFLVGYISSKVIRGRASDFILEIPPLRLPRIGNVVVKTLMRLEWYLKEAVPLFVLGTLILFTFDRLGILLWMQKAFSPVVVNILGLPAKASEAFIMGFLRRDYGAAGFKGLFDQGVLDPIGTIVAMTVITLFVPCIANFFIIVKERSVKTAIGMVLFIVPFAIIIGGLLNFALRGLGLWP
jgi:ferrous iron transport protein B